MFIRQGFDRDMFGMECLGLRISGVTLPRGVPSRGAYVGLTDAFDAFHSSKAHVIFPLLDENTTVTSYGTEIFNVEWNDAMHGFLFPLNWLITPTVPDLRVHVRSMEEGQKIIPGSFVNFELAPVGRDDISMDSMGLPDRSHTSPGTNHVRHVVFGGHEDPRPYTGPDEWDSKDGKGFDVDSQPAFSASYVVCSTKIRGVVCNGKCLAVAGTHDGMTWYECRDISIDKTSLTSLSGESLVDQATIIPATNRTLSACRSGSRYFWSFS